MFAIDQQPYLQGYLSVDSLWLYKNNGNVLGGGQPTLTGPFLVDKEQHRRSSASSRRPARASDRRWGVACRGGPRIRPPASEVRMSQTVDVGTPPAPAQDERVAQRSTLGRLLARPEIGALAGAIVIFLIFFIVAPPFREPSSLATVLYVSSTYGIPAVAVALLMIGGEFDLSAGVAVTASALVASMVSYQLSANMFVGVAGRPGRRAGDRLHQRLPGGEDGHPQLPGHPGHVLHAPGAQPGHHQDRHRQRRHQRRVRHRRLRDGQEHLRLPVHASGASRSGSRCSGGSCSSSSPPGSCSAPTSATGSSPSAAPRPAPGRSASRSTR